MERESRDGVKRTGKWFSIFQRTVVQLRITTRCSQEHPPPMRCKGETARRSFGSHDAYLFARPGSPHIFPAESKKPDSTDATTPIRRRAEWPNWNVRNRWR